jgi:hypothetical protein
MVYALELLQAREDDLAVGGIDPKRLELRFVQAEQLAAVYRTAHEQWHVLGQVDVILQPISTVPVGPILDVADYRHVPINRSTPLHLSEGHNTLSAELRPFPNQHGQLPEVRDLVPAPPTGGGCLLPSTLHLQIPSHRAWQARMMRKQRTRNAHPRYVRLVANDSRTIVGGGTPISTIYSMVSTEFGMSYDRAHRRSPAADGRQRYRPNSRSCK